MALVLIMSLVLVACGPTRAPTATDTPSPIATESPAPTPTIIPPTTSSSTIPPAEDTAGPPDVSARVWYLGSNGWAVTIGEKLLIFDYQEMSDPHPPAAGEARNLERGYIDVDELQAFDAYVFVTHSHQDHFTPLIFEWQDRVDRITYFFGWEAGNDPEHHYLVGPRATTQVGDMEVYTINSHHAGVPEVAFLVKVDGYTIYHNGDYRAEYVQDYDYLRTFTDHIDIAFVIGHPFVDHPYYQQAVRLSELFDPTYMFAINREGEEFKCRQFADLLAENGVEANVIAGERRGDHFACPRSAAE
jgi:L-ascorbate metabolism protein UlaG (beta-lactamase superfamily)